MQNSPNKQTPPSPIPKDVYWMRRALALARRALGSTQPNPLVGAIVLNSRGYLVGQGFHRKAGEPHAEVLALDQAGWKAKGGTLYVTLEPCAHFGKTPPCVTRIIQSGVARVVVGTKDPNSLVNGKGLEALQSAKLKVWLGVLESQSKRLNLPFETNIRLGRPLITAKAAISLDEKIGVVGKRIVLSGAACEKTTMKLRAEAGAIVIGIQTLLTDDPLLTVRGKYSSRAPIRAIVDPHLRTPPHARIFSNGSGEVWIFCRKDQMTDPKAEKLKTAGARLIATQPTKDGLLPPLDIVTSISESGATAILLEGGAKLFSTFSKAGLIDFWRLFRVRQNLGDSFEGRPTVPLSPDGGLRFETLSVIRRGADEEITAIEKI